MGLDDIILGKIGAERREELRRRWYKFKSNPLSMIGLAIVLSVVFGAVFAPYIIPYPESVGLYMNFTQAFQPPSLNHPFGTDSYGRDVFSRTIYGFRYSLLLAAVVLSIVVLPGTLLGMIAGYYRDTKIEVAIMRLTDIFLGVPPLILALSIASVLSPNLINSMIAITLMWWPWYTRLAYSSTSSVVNEPFIKAAQLIGASLKHILFKEIAPNIMGSILTKMTLDVGWVILIGASLSFLGLGAQPPTPDLGTMVAEGAKYLPYYWWVTLFPAGAIVYIILGFNLLGDGIRDALSSD
ncbi:MAG: ABC transporter permease [Fervidicoccaceae archaeon]